MTYYNTTHEPQTAEYREKAGRQDAAVLRVFAGLRLPTHNNAISPSACYAVLLAQGAITERTPLTSIRRSITNLTRAGKLRKTSRKVTGAYGRAEYTWEVV